LLDPRFRGDDDASGELDFLLNELIALRADFHRHRYRYRLFSSFDSDPDPDSDNELDFL